ncbi:hypothetical protein [Amycolatopsis albispora]|nr:hypothetical protein [Amycolatopsis albispora]
MALAGKNFPAGEDSDIGSENGCITNKYGMAAALDLDDRQGLADARPDPTKTYEGDINGRPILQVRENDGSSGMCKIFLEVAAKSRAIVSVTLGTKGTTDQACDEAGSVAQAIEPHLPSAVGN